MKIENICIEKSRFIMPKFSIELVYHIPEEVSRLSTKGSSFSQGTWSAYPRLNHNCLVYINAVNYRSILGNFNYENLWNKGYQWRPDHIKLYREDGFGESTPNATDSFINTIKDWLTENINKIYFDVAKVAAYRDRVKHQIWEVDKAKEKLIEQENILTRYQAELLNEEKTNESLSIEGTTE